MGKWVMFMWDYSRLMSQALRKLTAILANPRPVHFYKPNPGESRVIYGNPETTTGVEP